MHAMYDGELPDGWQGGTPVTKKWNGDFVHLYRVTRPCKTCAAEIAIDVTKKALQGFKKNAGLLLRNCPKCREARKAGGPGSRGGTSRPVAVDAGTPIVAEKTAIITPEELESLRTANITMKEELTGLYAQLKELRTAQSTAVTALNPQFTPPINDGFPQAENNSIKMPWES